jgi:hypothetical protein
MSTPNVTTTPKTANNTATLTEQAEAIRRHVSNAEDYLLGARQAIDYIWGAHNDEPERVGGHILDALGGIRAAEATMSNIEDAMRGILFPRTARTQPPAPTQPPAVAQSPAPKANAWPPCSCSSSGYVSVEREEMRDIVEQMAGIAHTAMLCLDCHEGDVNTKRWQPRMFVLLADALSALEPSKG